MHMIRGADYLSRYPNFKLVGRDQEIERISSILIRKMSNSLLLTGPAGVGTSALVLGLQAMKDIPGTSFDIISKRLFWLDTDRLFSSGDGREINDNFQKMLRQLHQTPDSILIIPDTSNFIEAANNTGNSHFINAINSIDKAYSTFQVIMEVRDENLTKVLKWNTAISELYTLYDVKEPVGESLMQIVTSASDSLRLHHDINIDSSAIAEAIHLTSKYRDSLGLGGAQPQRSISLLDRSLSSYRQFAHRYHPDWKAFEKEIEETHKRQRDGEELLFELQNDLDMTLKEESEAKEKLKHETPQVKTFTQLASGSFDSSKVTKLKSSIKQLQLEISANGSRHKELVAQANKNLLLTRREVIVEFSKISGIPAKKLDENEIENLIHLEDNFLSRIFGQEEVVRHITNAIKVSKIDTMEESGPAISYLFLGPSGVGKTEMAKTIAQYVLGDEKALVRFDMSEYMEKHAVAKLIGAPPGYEGFEAGGILTNTVRKKPVGVYLFDEIEKAHPDVFNIFLQVLSDGRLTDNIGRTVDFSDIIIIMTSNIGQPYYLDMNLSDEAAKELATEELNRTYRSELLNRFNGRENILHFKRLPLAVIEKIIHREINKLRKSYKERNLDIMVSDACIHNFCRDHYDPVRGARGLPGYIKTNLRPVMVNHILLNPDAAGKFCLSYNTDAKVFEIVFEKSGT